MTARRSSSGVGYEDGETAAHRAYREAVSKPKHKYGAIETVVDGIVFPSKAEARRYGELRLLEQAGAISDLELQPKYSLEVNGMLICRYIGDFVYLDRGKGHKVLEDTKGVKTPTYRLKKKLMQAIHGIEIVEVQS